MARNEIIFIFGNLLIGAFVIKKIRSSFKENVPTEIIEGAYYYSKNLDGTYDVIRIIKKISNAAGSETQAIFERIFPDKNFKFKPKKKDILELQKIEQQPKRSGSDKIECIDVPKMIDVKQWYQSHRFISQSHLSDQDLGGFIVWLLGTNQIPINYDPLNPTESEVRSWAYNLHSPLSAPYVDQELIPLSEHEDLFIEFITDPECPRQDFFISCMYALADICNDVSDLHRIRQKIQFCTDEEVVKLQHFLEELTKTPRRYWYLCCQMRNIEQGVFLGKRDEDRNNKMTDRST